MLAIHTLFYDYWVFVIKGMKGHQNNVYGFEK